MLTIRPEQIRIFARADEQKFEQWMLAHLRRYFPRQCETTGESQLRETIRNGIERAATYAITDRRDVSKFIDLMVVFGRDFDQKYSWAADILNKPRPPHFKMRVLHLAARKHLAS